MDSIGQTGQAHTKNVGNSNQKYFFDTAKKKFFNFQKKIDKIDGKIEDRVLAFQSEFNRTVESQNQYTSIYLSDFSKDQQKQRQVLLNQI